jgi:hypothetical protein
MKRVIATVLVAALVSAGIAGLLALTQSTSAQQQGVSVEPFIWQFDEDYPKGTPPDEALPVSTVYLKTHDGTQWMSKWDEHPAAIDGTRSLQRAVQVYKDSGIRTIAWFVPRGHDYYKQRYLARAVIDAGVDTLYADVEDYEGFCHTDCRVLAEKFWKPLRAERPNANLGVIYDPRPEHRDLSAASAWLSVADAALPMCYWDSFEGQPPWDTPRGCIREAAADLKAMTGGREIEYIPIAQGDTSAAKMKQGVQAVEEVGGTRISIWRRGVVPRGLWKTIANWQPAAPAATPVPSPPAAPAKPSPAAEPPPAPPELEEMPPAWWLHFKLEQLPPAIVPADRATR